MALPSNPAFHSEICVKQVISEISPNWNGRRVQKAEFSRSPRSAFACLPQLRAGGHALSGPRLLSPWSKTPNTTTKRGAEASHSFVLVLLFICRISLPTLLIFRLGHGDEKETDFVGPPLLFNDDAREAPGLLHPTRNKT